MDKKKLQETVNQTLQWNDFSLNDEELDEIIKLYDHYLDFLLEATHASRSSYHDRYGFIDGHKEIDIEYKRIFTDIAIIKKYNYEGCLDYFRILNGLRGPIYNISRTLFVFTNNLSAHCLRNKDNNDSNRINDDINSFWNHDEGLLTVWIDDTIIDWIVNSSYVPNTYKIIMLLYNDLVDLLHCNESLNKYNIPFERIINMSYFYFIVHNYLNTEPDNVISFLTHIRDNPNKILDYFNMCGITFRNDFYDYFDYIYKGNKNNQKVIK